MKNPPNLNSPICKSEPIAKRLRSRDPRAVARAVIRQRVHLIPVPTAVEMCPICLDVLETEPVRIHEGCGKGVHASCLKTFLGHSAAATRCVLCRQEVRLTQEERVERYKRGNLPLFEHAMVCSGGCSVVDCHLMHELIDHVDGCSVDSCPSCVHYLISARYHKSTCASAHCAICNLIQLPPWVDATWVFKALFSVRIVKRLQVASPDNTARLQHYSRPTEAQLYEHQTCLPF